MTVQIEHVPLERLRFGHDKDKSINSRTAGRSAGIEELANSIARVGLVVPLVVQKNGQDYYVADGNRRLAALQLLNKRAPESERQNADWQALLDHVPVIDRKDADGMDLSTVANIDRLPLHPVDKCEAFAVRVDAGFTVAQVAEHYSLKVREVEQALAVRALAPEVRDAWRSGEIKAEVAQAFTLEPDQKRQAQALAKLKKHNNLWDGAVRRELVGERGDASKFLAFVGVEAYEAAGGNVARDLFRERHAVSDLALLKRLVDERLNGICVWLVSEGWAWALPAEEVKNLYSFGRVRADEKPTKQERARLKELDRLCDREGEEGEISEEVQAAFAERDRIGQAITLRAFTPEQKKRSGCIVSLDHDGELEIAAGFVMPMAKVEKAAAKGAAAAPSPADKKKAEAARTRKAAAGEVSKSLDQDLLDVLRDATARALKVEAARFDKAKQPLPFLLASAVAQLVDADSVGRYNRPVNEQVEHMIREAISPAIMSEVLRAEFDPKDYFGRVPKANMLAIVREIETGGRLKFPGADKMKTAALAKWCAANAPEQAWLPVQLRGSWYDGGPRAGKQKRRGRK